MSGALHDGSGVFGLLERVDKAAQHVYLANGYQKADFEWAFLMWKLGGRSAANITFHTLGIPSIESARWHIWVSPITVSPGLPTQAEMESNISQCFLEWEDVPQITTIQWRVVEMTMPIDKLKIQPHLQWDPYTNMIFGVCWEHGGSCCLEFWTIVQADILCDCLQWELIHLASEVQCFFFYIGRNWIWHWQTKATVIVACILTDNPKEYIAHPFIISGTCKTEDYQVQ